MIPAPEGSGVGGLIRRHRQMAGLTQEELGEKADLSVRAVRNLEQGKVWRPRRSTLQRLALALGLNKLDAAGLFTAARMIDRPVTPASAVPGRAGWPAEWLGLQPVLAQLIELFGAERVLVVPVFLACPACSAPAVKTTPLPDWRPEPRWLAVRGEHLGKPGDVVASTEPRINGRR
jgi:transcriptional regulator with XRE-family HTH domain